MSDWFPWLKNELEKKGFTVEVPLMPNPDVPVIDAWVGKLSEIIGNDTSDLILVGHSIGTQTIQRYLAEHEIMVRGIALVAPWYTLDMKALAGDSSEAITIGRPWLETPINFENVMKRSPKRIVIFSDNDAYVPYEENKKLFEKNIQPEIITLHNKGHISEGDGVTEVPEILDAVLKITSTF